jgi:hypothetical protein
MQQPIVKFTALSYRHCSTCFGHYIAYHQEPVKLPLQPLVLTNRPRLRTLPPTHSYGNQRLQWQFDGLLMMGIVMPETCWAVSVRQDNKFYDWLLHLVGCFVRVIYMLLSASFSKPGDGRSNLSGTRHDFLGTRQFFVFILPDQRLYNVKNMCVCVCVYKHIWRRKGCIWITVAANIYCGWNIFTQTGSGVECWLDIYNWGAGLAVTAGIRVEVFFQTESSSSPPVKSKFSTLSPSSMKPLLEM